MSRRESCVWHPMPEEVRRSSVQSRRASLAAGRRKDAGNEPDWEVEAPPTPPHHEEPQQQQPEPVPEPVQEPVPEPQPEQQPEPAPEPTAEAEASSEPANEEPPVVEERAAAPAPEEPQQPQPEEEKEEEIPIEDAPVAEPKTVEKKMRTRHSVRFRGSEWGAVKAAHEEQLKAAFLEDLKVATGIEAEATSQFEITVTDAMVIAFVLTHPRAEKNKQGEIHDKLREFDFPKVCDLYLSKDAAAADEL